MRIQTVLALLVSSLVPSAALAQSTVHPFVGAPEDQALIDDVLDGWFAPGAPERIVHVAPPDGTTVGTGTAADPYRDLIRVVAEATAGTAIYLAPGVYPMSEIRDTFGHNASALRTRSSGARGKPIVLSTDPGRYDPEAGTVAILDFGYDNEIPNSRTMAIVLSDDYWLLENLEIRHMYNRGIWLSGHNNVIRNNYIHHVDTDGTNNQGLIVIGASGGRTNNVIMGNHFSHAGVLDRTSGALLNPGGVNGGCIYTETRQTYDSTVPAPSSGASLDDLLAGVLPADSHAYIYNNYAHHCAYAYGTKTQNEGPYFFLSNVAHDVRIGVRNTFSMSVIRNNIFFAGAGDVKLESGVRNGYSADAFWGEIFNGHRSEISHNTIVGAASGLFVYSGWGVRSHDNLVVRTQAPFHVHRNQYHWYENGAWPGIRGEWLLGDLNPAHPYYAQMPQYLKDMEGTFVRFRATDNCYDKEPTIGKTDFVQPANDVTGMTVDEDYAIVPEAEIDGLFVDTETYVRDRASGKHEGCGSRVVLKGMAPPPPLPDEGGPGGPGTDPDPAEGSPGTSPGEEEGAAAASTGCGCRAVSPEGRVSALLAPLALSALLLARRRRS